VIVDTNKQTEWHLIYVSAEGGIKGHNIAETPVLHLAPTICPDQGLHSIQAIQVNTESKFWVLIPHFSEDLKSLLNIVIHLFTSYLGANGPQRPLREGELSHTAIKTAKYRMYFAK
jgi:hypothetical protein